MTEDEAKATVCCNDKDSLCCASNCMAWRWIKPTTVSTWLGWSNSQWRNAARMVDGGTELAGRSMLQEEWYKNNNGDPPYDKPTKGYCGLAGKP